MNFLKHATAIVILGGYMLAAQDTQPWWVSFSTVILVGSFFYDFGQQEEEGKNEHDQAMDHQQPARDGARLERRCFASWRSRCGG